MDNPQKFSLLTNSLVGECRRLTPVNPVHSLIQTGYKQNTTD